MSTITKRKGFTLMELLVVMVVSAFVILTVGGGVVTLQSNIKGDNAIRYIKSQIQSAQAAARTSFIVSQRGEGSQDFFSSGSGFASLGWILEFENKGGKVLITRRSVYFPVDTSYPIRDLKIDIDNFHALLNRGTQSIANKKTFGCRGSNLYFGDVWLSGPTNGFDSVGGKKDVFCATSSSGSTEFTENEIENLEVVEIVPGSPPNALKSCFEISGQRSVFFASGYGKPVLNFGSDCQLVIRTTGVGSTYRALSVSATTGVVEICGAYCVR